MMLRKSLGEPDEVRRVGRGRIEIVNLPGVCMGRAILEPGWRWSEDVKPIAGTHSCQVAHTAVVISGRMHVRMDDGSELDLAPGDAHVVSAGHDAWVVGDEPLIVIDVVGVETFGKPDEGNAGGGRAIDCPCGVTFSVPSKDAIEHLLKTVQEHAGAAHSRSLSREDLLAVLKTSPALVGSA